MGLLDDLKGKVDSVLDKTDLDDKALAAAGSFKDKAGEALEKAKLDEKAKAAGAAIKEKAGAALDKTDLDEKILGKAESEAKEIEEQYK